MKSAYLDLPHEEQRLFRIAERYGVPLDLHTLCGLENVAKDYRLERDIRRDAAELVESHYEAMRREEEDY